MITLLLVLGVWVLLGLLVMWGFSRWFRWVRDGRL